MVIKRVYFIQPVMNMGTAVSLDTTQKFNGKDITLKYSEKLNSIIVNDTIIVPMHMVREIIIEEIKETKKSTTKD